MKKKVILPIFSICLIISSALISLNLKPAGAASLVEQKNLILYDAASGAIPGATLMDFTDFPPGAAQPTYSNGVTVMDSTAAGDDTYAGWVASAATTPGFPMLDRAAGFQVNFSIQMESESHASSHRAGFSVILLGNDAKGVELAFWQNEIWAQSDDATGELFRHGEGVTFDTTTGQTDYQLTIVGDIYTLTANATPILSGPVRDYSAFDGFPDPYETPNFLFLGDDTTSAQARVQLRFVAITGTEPVMPTETGTVTLTSSPEPAASFTPVPSATPAPSPTPVGRALQSCPSAWIFLGVIFATPRVMKKIRAG